MNVIAVQVQAPRSVVTRIGTLVTQIISGNVVTSNLIKVMAEVDVHVKKFGTD